MSLTEGSTRGLVQRNFGITAFPVIEPIPYSRNENPNRTFIRPYVVTAGSLHNSSTVLVQNPDETPVTPHLSETIRVNQRGAPHIG
jgi:hypothetical protein